jgi:hypothetical protein
MKKLFFLFLLAGSQWMTAQAVMHIGLTIAELTSTQKVYNVYVKNYDQILASQYSLSFDPQKMTFAGVRQSIPDGLGNSCFGTPFPGIATHAWIQTDLDPDSYIDSTVIYQLVFNVLQPGGSTLCFTNVPLDYEFVKPDEELVEPFFIHDDCYSGDVLIDPSTGIHEPTISTAFQLQNISLSDRGEMTFNLKKPDQLRFTLYETNGKEIAGSNTKSYSTGRSTVNFGHALNNEIYLIKVTGTSGLVQTIKAFAK